MLFVSPNIVIFLGLFFFVFFWKLSCLRLHAGAVYHEDISGFFFSFSLFSFLLFSSFILVPFHLLWIFSILGGRLCIPSTCFCLFGGLLCTSLASKSVVLLVDIPPYKAGSLIFHHHFSKTIQLALTPTYTNIYIHKIYFGYIKATCTTFIISFWLLFDPNSQQLTEMYLVSLGTWTSRTDLPPEEITTRLEAALRKVRERH